MDCCVKNCDVEGYALNLCHYHYNVNKRHGTPVPRARTKDVCAFGPCERLATGKKPLCKSHQNQAYHGRELTQLERKRQAYPIIDGQRRCLNCDQVKALSEFYRSKNAASGYRPTCGKCVSADIMERRRGREDN